MAQLRVLFFLLALLTAFRLYAASHVGLTHDEAYYWLWAQNLALSYFDHPPMVAYFIKGSTLLLGDTPLGIRIFSILLGAVSSLVMYKISLKMGFSRNLAFLSALLMQATLFIGVGSLIISPDTPLLLFWMLGFYYVLKSDINPKNWLWVGLWLGLGALSKFSIVFFIPGLLLWIMFYKPKHLLSPWLYAGGIIALLCVTPLIYWNMQHEWIGLIKQGGRLASHPLQPKMLPEFLGALFGLFTPLIVIMAGFGLKNNLTQKINAQWSFALLNAAPLLAYMLWFSLFDRVQGNWIAPLLPTVILLALLAPEHKIFHAAVPFGMGLGFFILSFILIFPSLLPKGPLSQFKDWDKLADKILGFNEPLLLTHHYTVNAQLAYALKGKMQVKQCGEEARYLMQPAFTPPPKALILSQEQHEGALATLPHNDKIYYLYYTRSMCKI